MTGASSPLVSSKHPSRRARNEFYRYYAGYPTAFAIWALGELDLKDGAFVLDPWNGSGTTAAACLHLGYSFEGFDINPVMVHLGRARIAANVDFEEALESIDQLRASADVDGDISLAKLGSLLRSLPVGNEAAHSIALAALFPMARNLLANSRTKNPAWFRRGTSLGSEELDSSTLFSEWRRLVGEISAWRNVTEEHEGLTATVSRGDARKSLGRAGSFDGLLTSPPYLTRLDYVQATLPELLLLAELDVAPDLQRLRRSMLGSPLTSERPDQSVERLPQDVRDILQRISAHSSKASSSYYKRFFTTYFVDLHSSLKNVAKVLKGGAEGCIVVQSSNYKDIEVRLDLLLGSMCRSVGLAPIRQIEFQSRRSMSLVNSRAHQDARRPKNEVAVFIKKD